MPSRLCRAGRLGSPSGNVQPLPACRLVRHLDRQPPWEAGDVIAQREQSGLSRQDDSNQNSMSGPGMLLPPPRRP